MSIQSAITQVDKSIQQRFGNSSELADIFSDMRSLMQALLTIAQDTQAMVAGIQNRQNPTRDKDIAHCLCELLELEKLLLCVLFGDSQEANQVKELNEKLPALRDKIQSCCCYLSQDQKQRLDSCYAPLEYNCLFKEQLRKKFENVHAVSTALRQQLSYQC